MTRAIILGFFLVLGMISCRKSDYTIENTETITDQGGGTGTTTWTRNKDYIISGFVFVNDGQTLTIEPGTVIRAKTGQGSLSSALIVAKGGTIIAEGEIGNPIIFTVEGDDLEGSVPVMAKGLWGGVIILGNATINTTSGEDLIEGIPISEPRGVYGGGDDDDNSGILKYISIRHGGTNIGEGNEINGLTLGGVGRQTIVEDIEVISNADDGVEIFGGSVNCRNIVVSFCGDDAFDIDQGYHGKGQFLLAINGPDSDKCAEYSGGLKPVQLLPGSFPLLHNVTLFGDPSGQSDPGIHFSLFGGGDILNSIFMYSGKGIAIKYSDQPGDSYSLYESGFLTTRNNILYPDSGAHPSFYCYSDDNRNLDAQNAEMADSLTAWVNLFEDPGIFSEVNTYKVLPSSTVFDQMAEYENDWFEKVTYKGAFGSKNWLENWTLIFEEGFILD